MTTQVVHKEENVSSYLLRPIRPLAAVLSPFEAAAEYRRLVANGGRAVAFAMEYENYASEVDYEAYLVALEYGLED